MTGDAEFSLMAGVGYRSTRDAINRFPIPGGWSEVPRSHVNMPSGFEAVSFQHDNEIVIAFAGTGPGLVDWDDNLLLWGGLGSQQLREAAAYYMEIRQANPDARITLTGHSLGGGLASLIGVFFDEAAVVFDTAPFRASANNDVRNALVNYLGDLGYTEGPAIDTLKAFHSDETAEGTGESDIPGIRGEENIRGVYVQGETLHQYFSRRIGRQAPIPHGIEDVSSGTLHALALLAAFELSDVFREATTTLPDLGKMLFDGDLYAHDTSQSQENFLERLVRHQVGVDDQGIPADEMLDRFARDLQTISQSDAANPNRDDGKEQAGLRGLSQTLIAFAMQMYYDNPRGSDRDKVLFNDLDAVGGKNTVSFDINDVAPSLDVTKGYQLYFRDYLQQAGYTEKDRALIAEQLPALRDWYVQVGPEAMNAADTQGRGAFMLGGKLADELTGGAASDLLVGWRGNDELAGGGQNDTLVGGPGMDLIEGGSGNDTLYGSDVEEKDDHIPDLLAGGPGNDTYHVNFGDVIDDTQGSSTVYYNGELISGTYERIVGTDIYRQQGGVRRLWIDGEDTAHLMGSYLKVNNFDASKFGITLSEGSGAPAEREIKGDYQWTDFDAGRPGIQVHYDELNNPIQDLLRPTSWKDALNGSDGADHIQSGALEDQVSSLGGNDRVEGGAGTDILAGGTGDDRIYADGEVRMDAALAADTGVAGGDRDWLNGGAGDDLLVGGSGENGLAGGGGNDVIVAGAGDDNIFGDSDWTAQGFDWTYTDTTLPDGTVERAFSPVVGDEDPADSGADTIYAGSGADWVWAGAGDDVVFAGSGADRVLGEAGDDVLLGEAGKDQLIGDDNAGRVDPAAHGADYLDGGAGDDELTGGGGSDFLYGGDDNDLLVGDDDFISLEGQYHGNDYLDGGAGDDELQGDGGDDTLHGGADNDKLFGDATTLDPAYHGDDELYGDGGDDVLIGGGGNDWLYGGDDNDFLDGDDHVDNLVSAEHGDDYLDGGAGDDIVVGSGGHDVLYGGAGDDELQGDGPNVAPEDQGDDYLDGGSGNDVLAGFGGADTLLGGADNDQLYGDYVDTPAEYHGDDYLDGGTGDDVLVGGGGADTLYGGDGNDQMDGDSSDLAAEHHGDDVLDGGDGNDILWGSGGADTLSGGRGDDELYGDSDDIDSQYQDNDHLDGGQGDDKLVGHGGDDTLTGGDGNDSLYGDGGASADVQGADTLSGGDGNDLLVGGGGADSLYGGSGNDYLYGDSGGVADAVSEAGDTLDGGDGDDVLIGGIGNDELTGGDGADQLYGGADDDTLHGGAGDDLLIAGTGQDVLSGGAGVDTYVFNAGDGVDVITDAGSNTLRFGPGIGVGDISLALGSLMIKVGDAGDAIHIEGFNPDDPYANVAIDRFEFNDGTVLTYNQLIDLGFDLDGTSGGDVIDGTGIGDRIRGYAGDDAIRAKGGNDWIDGGTGSDAMSGGAGDDVYIVDNAGDTVTENADEGHDRVEASVSYGLAANVEDLTLTGSDAIDGTGNGLDNTLTGNDAANALAGADGNDALHGAGGDDLLDGGTGEDLLYGEAGDDTLAGADGNDMLRGDDGADRLNGGAGDDALYGGAGGDVLDGGSGADLMVGGAGDDSYRVDSAQDAVLEAQEQDGYDTVVSSVSYELGNFVEELTLAGTDAIDGSGTLFTQRIEGNAADNNLYAYRLNGRADNMPDMSITIIGTPHTGIAERLFDRAALAIYRGYDPTGGLLQLQPQQGATLVGNGGDDRLFGDLDNDTLVGGAGDDVLYGLGGSDVMIGGSGDDTYIVDGPMTLNYTARDLSLRYQDSGADQLVEQADGGTDTVLATGDFTLAENFENLVLLNDTSAYDQDTGIYGVPASTGRPGAVGIGNAADNRIEGSDYANELQGRGGDDNLIGGGGADRLDGGAGADVMDGGGGSDTYVVDELGDQVIETDATRVNGGTDTVEAGIDYVLGANLENLTLTGAAVTGTGNELANVLRGNGRDNVLTGLDGDDTLDGGAGADILQGGRGNDTYIVDDPADTVVENSGEGVDEVHSTITYTLGADLENLQLDGVDAIDGTGNALDNRVTGNAGDNTLSGEAGDDVLAGDGGADVLLGGAGDDQLDGGLGGDRMEGGAGDDDYVVDDAADTVVEAPGAGVDSVQSSVSFTLSANVDNLTLTGEAGLAGTGNELDNVIVGTNYADILSGEAGNDTIDGAAGNDQLYGGLGDDYLYGGDDAAGPPPPRPAIVAAAFLGGDELPGDGGPGPLFPNDDYLDGGLGVDTLDGGTGNDLLYGGGDADTLFGRSGNDLLDGGTGIDTMAGGSGDDVYYVDGYTEVVTTPPSDGGGDGSGSGGSTCGGDSFSYGSYPYGGADWFGYGYGGGCGFTVNQCGYPGGWWPAPYTAAPGLDCGCGGDGGDDGADDGDSGGQGQSTIHYVTDLVVEDPGQGYDVVYSSITYTLTENVEELHLLGADAAGGTGNAVDNLIIGNDGDNVLAGMAGNDTLRGNAGNDVLDGGTGIDHLAGGTGDDVYVVDDPGDVVTEQAGEGNDTIRSAIAYGLVANVENLELTGDSAIDASGDANDNVLIGNEGSNVLTGNEGNDTLDGGAGNDTLVGGSGDDIYRFRRGNGVDTIEDDTSGANTVSFGDGIDRDHVAARTTTAGGLTSVHVRLLDDHGSEQDGQGLDYRLGENGDSPIAGFTFADGSTASLDDLLIEQRQRDGTCFSDYIVTGRHDDTVYAKWGNDFVRSGTGNDNLYGDSGCDVLDAEAGNDWLYGGGGDDLLLGGYDEDVLYGGSEDDRLDGGADSDLLSGDKGGDRLAGGSGNDLVAGGQGDDHIAVECGRDVVLYNRGDGDDTLEICPDVEGLTLSLGGGIGLGDLDFRRECNDLVLEVAEDESGYGWGCFNWNNDRGEVVFDNWYGNAWPSPVQPQVTLQIIMEASSEFDAGSSDPRYDQRVETFDFNQLVSQYDAAQNNGWCFSPWSLVDGALAAHLEGSDSEALGGELGYRYGLDGSLDGVSPNTVLATLSDPRLGRAPQTLGLNDGAGSP